ncbi:MAG: fumarylacetoacetate hydrolase, partial [Pseudomonadota bacterium]
MKLPHDALLVGRAWRPGIGPALVTLRDGAVVDITTRAAPTMRDLMELDDPAAHVRATAGEAIGALDTVVEASIPGAGEDVLHLLAPTDLQAIKASGVTFAESMVERVIEEQAAGDPARAEA